MRRALAVALASSALSWSASALAEEVAGSGLRPFIGVGLTSGGNTVLRVTTTVKGSTQQYQEDISAGGGLDLRLGLSYRIPGQPFSIQGSWGLHNDQSNGVDGERYSFRRYPVEAQLQWHVTDRGKIGFGVRKATRPVLSIVNGSIGDQTLMINERYTLKSSMGMLVEGEYALTPSWGIKARYVHEYFTFDDKAYNPDKVKADHVGLITVFYFN